MKQLIKKFQHKKFIAALLVVIFGAVFGLHTLFAHAAATLYAGLGANNVKVLPGDTVQFTFALRNDGDVDFHDLITYPTFPTELTYVNGSAKVVYNQQEYPISDAWVTTQTNIGTLPQAVSKEFKFSAQVVGSAAVGAKPQMIYRLNRQS